MLQLQYEHSLIGKGTGVGRHGRTEEQELEKWSEQAAQENKEEQN